MQNNLMMNLLNKILIWKNKKTKKPYNHQIPDSVNDFHKNIDIIIDEWKQYVNNSFDSGKPIDELSAEQTHLNEDKKWKALFIFIMGEVNPQVEFFFPKTIEITRKWKKEVNLVFFSHLLPGKHIPPHKGNNYYVIRSQIGIDIFQPDKTGLRVEDKTIKLKERELFIFDDTFEHEAWNYSSTHRTVLIIDTRKKFPYFYNLINKFLLRKMKRTKYVQEVIRKLKN
jgi:aspartyl/asparaginyl beta-hydroxylase (cupin superfamily)